ncbi:ribonuclease H2 subunit C [Tiliqua scincoides]|uniref:ribonuclease H2 subunit C n=1 Tax=Tiliqua scincoides TaxID=71010 RepID=UPI0034632E6E
MAGCAEAARRRLALDSLPGAPRARLHLLPCSVEHDGAAPVQRFFAPALRGQAEPAVSFRGRSLKGKQVLLPEGYVGLVVEEDPAPFLESEEQKLQVKSTFESLTVWNLERAPDSNAEVIMAFGWPKIAEGIHAPVAEEE